MKQDHVLTDWRGGYSKGKAGGSYGLRFGKLRDSLIDGKPDTLELYLANHGVIMATVTEGFWHHCPEVRHPQIGPWMKSQGIKLPWPLGKPPRFKVAKLGANHFKVTGPI